MFYWSAFLGPGWPLWVPFDNKDNNNSKNNNSRTKTKTKTTTARKTTTTTTTTTKDINNNRDNNNRDNNKNEDNFSRNILSCKPVRNVAFLFLLSSQSFYWWLIIGEARLIVYHYHSKEVSIHHQSSSAGKEWMGPVMALNVNGNAFRVTSNTIDRQKRLDGKYSGKVNFKTFKCVQGNTK